MNLSRTSAEQRPLNGATAKQSQQPLGSLSFFGFAVISFGGPLALAGLIAPEVITGAGPHASDSAGLAIVISVVVFAVPLLIWLRYRETHQRFRRALRLRQGGRRPAGCAAAGGDLDVQLPALHRLYDRADRL